MHISMEIDYGVRSMVVIATGEGEVLSKRAISATFNIPVNFLAIILPKLVKAGLVTSMPGPGGGYKLSRAPEKISLREVVCVVQPEFALVRCAKENKKCNEKVRCPVTKYWSKLQDNVEAYLDTINLKMLAQEYVERNGKPDFASIS